MSARLWQNCSFASFLSRNNSNSLVDSVLSDQNVHHGTGRNDLLGNWPIHPEREILFNTQKFTRFDFSFCTLQEQERPSGQSGRRDPRGSQEQVGGRPPSGRQSLEVPSVASPVYPASQSSHSSPVVWSRQFMQTPESGSHSLEWPLQLQGSQSPK